ncbi:hypothetical protein [Acetobacter sp.]|jgi:hypothetical protein|uniref:hypothetical protein n=1 Tax=Acetobacter sp. TaxID=440 RepID=UPI0025BD2426|nr:hypothetical protein [Acetobacter sp.]MCH4091342.1 hypothetical protein [Acetobacter sp.]MCI1299320.1 hypothetical protein [Acetobacter sp.]MCI1316676.1 hypothetical protein [Acetobacter sp.]
MAFVYGLSECGLKQAKPLGCWASKAGSLLLLGSLIVPTHAGARTPHTQTSPQRVVLHGKTHHTKKSALQGCLSGGSVIVTHGRTLGAIGSHGKLLAPVGRAIYYTDSKHGCLPGKHTRRRG